jgi:23S rRNA (guanosine2251-2'-O)-methyltransferase
MTRPRTTRDQSDGPLAVYGGNAVAELLRGGQPVVRLCLGRGPREAELASAARRRGIPVETLDRSTLDRLAGSPHHQGAVAVIPSFPYVPLEQVLEAGSALLLDGIQDPRNLGAILRAARAAGVGGVVLPRDRSSPVTPVAVAASAGLALDLPVARVTNLVRAGEALKEGGFWLLGLVPRDGQRLDRLEVPARPALVVGGEGEGIRPLVRRSCDFLVTIPMAAGVESLNVAVAVGVALYEVLLRGKG